MGCGKVVLQRNTGYGFTSPVSAGAFRVPHYSFLCYADDGSLTIHEREIADDLDALDEAKKLCAEHDVEIRCGDRFVAHVKKGNAPDHPSDPRSG